MGYLAEAEPGEVNDPSTAPTSPFAAPCRGVMSPPIMSEASAPLLPFEPVQILRRLVRSVPPQALSDLVIEILQRSITAPTLYVEIPNDETPAKPARIRNVSKPTRRARGRPRKRPVGKLAKGARGTGSNQHRKVRVSDGPAPPTLADQGVDKHLAKRAAKAPYGVHPAAFAKAEPTVMRFWQAAEALNPGSPWKPVADRLGINLAQAQDAHREYVLPVGVSETQAAAFG